MVQRRVLEVDARYTVHVTYTLLSCAGTLRLDLRPWESIEAIAPGEAHEAEVARRAQRIAAADPRARGGIAAERVLAADAFVIEPATRTEVHAKRADARTLVARYPWFTDWGRDTMISLEGLTLLAGRHTCMDAKLGDWVVAPRRGKAVEINALFFNALRLLCDWLSEHGEPARALAAVLDARHRELLTPAGLRSLSRAHPEYEAHYSGDLHARDAASHQGTVWGWLIGPFADAWQKVRPDDRAGLRRAIEGFTPHLDEACIGTVGEVFDGVPSSTARGCFAQASSVAELLRCHVMLVDG